MNPIVGQRIEYVNFRIGKLSFLIEPHADQGRDAWGGNGQ
jgi:hypothetical protein